jgi:hypothetical protein
MSSRSPGARAPQRLQLESPTDTLRATGWTRTTSFVRPEHFPGRAQLPGRSPGRPLGSSAQ